MGLFGGRRTVPGNGRPVLAWLFGPDRWGVQAASLGAMTNTASPGSSGRVAPARSFVSGLQGFGVNRWAGAPRSQPVQQFHGLVAPVFTPDAQRLGAGAGPSGQPGLPSTGDLSGYLGLGWPLTPGMGG